MSNGRTLQRMMELARSLGGRCEIGTTGKKVDEAVNTVVKRLTLTTGKDGKQVRGKST